MHFQPKVWQQGTNHGQINVIFKKFRKNVTQKSAKILILSRTSFLADLWADCPILSGVFLEYFPLFQSLINIWVKVPSNNWMDDHMYWNNRFRTYKSIWVYIEILHMFTHTNNWNIKCKLPSDAGDLHSLNGVRISRPRAGESEPWSV